jgi:catechol 2,3-dioxygenase-like lactoylglutathione lyase family enzyme
MLTTRGILESSLYVDDLPRSAEFYRSLFEFDVLASDDRFCALNAGDRQILLLFRRDASSTPSVLPGGTIPGHEGRGRLHLAFAIDRDDLEAWQRRLQERGIPIESQVNWPRGGVSLYFRDLDSNLIELATPGIWATY